MNEPNIFTSERFPLGHIVSTPGALDALARNHQGAIEFLIRHGAGDWGEVCAEDAAANNAAIDSEARLLSVYQLTDQTRLWIITESNRHVTTLLLPEEY